MDTKRYNTWTVLLITFWSVVSTKGECAPPPYIEHSGNNATLDASFPEGTGIHYVCDFTTYRHGWPIYTCHNGSWSNGENTNLQCIWKTCSPPTIEHGTYRAPSLTVGNMARFKCDKGYKLRGSSKALCRIDKRWRRLPTCHIVKCVAPRRLSHMSRFLNTHHQEPNIYGNAIHNTCEEGYNLIGPSVQKCEGDGQWTRPTPYCAEIDCGKPDIGSGKASYETTTFMSNIWIDCNEDAVQEGEESMFCFEDGWTYSYCHGPCQVLSIEHGEVGMGRIAFKERLEWKCNSGYVKTSLHDITCIRGNLTETPACRQIQFGNEPTCPGALPSGYHVTRFHDKCYIFIDVHVTYRDAKQRCITHGWAPVTIVNDQETEFVSLATRLLWNEETWLGIEFSDVQDSWMVPDGTKVRYTNWLAGQGGRSWWFNKKFENCAVLEAGRDGMKKWDDIECYNLARVMCQKEPV